MKKQPNESDEAVAARAAAGDAGAFQELVTRYQHRMFRLARRLAGTDDALDVVQETFLRTYRSLGSFRGESRFSTWLYRIATNTALMHRRSRARRRTEPLDCFLPQFGPDGRHRPTPAALRVVSRAEERVEDEALARHVAEALERLPATYRAPFVLRDLEELPTDEVARMLGLRPATVRQRVHRARLLLRGYLSHVLERSP